MNMTMIPLSTTSRELSGLRGDSRLEGVLGAARELVAFAESEPMLASRAGVEVLALEAKVLMQKVNLSGSRCGLGRADFALLERLDGIVSISNNRMDECIASMDEPQRDHRSRWRGDRDHP
jgi:hypothetical protein